MSPVESVTFTLSQNTTTITTIKSSTTITANGNATVPPTTLKTSSSQPTTLTQSTSAEVTTEAYLDCSLFSDYKSCVIADQKNCDWRAFDNKCVNHLPKYLCNETAGQSENCDSSSHSKKSSKYVIISVAILLIVASIGAWTFYAVRNPRTGSGEFLQRVICISTGSASRSGDLYEMNSVSDISDTTQVLL